MTPPAFRNTVLHGDCCELMRDLPASCVDLVLTDPPYLIDYRSRSGESVRNDDNNRWLKPAFAEVGRVMRPGGFCVSFYGWQAADQFIDAWRAAGLRIAGHLVFRKPYASSVRYLAHHHEQAYLLTKGRAVPPPFPLPDTFGWDYTGNRLHPTQKPLRVLKPLVRTFCPEGGLVLDPFCGSGSTLVAARDSHRAYLGMDIEQRHCRTALRRLR
jgi:site-specific DNA-methyltransferase (adenine-specific)